jgi:hypothetical protein
MVSCGSIIALIYLLICKISMQTCVQDLFFIRKRFLFSHACVTRVNSANALDEGVRIGGNRPSDELEGRINQTRRGLVCIENKYGTQLAQSQSVPGQPLLTPLYRWPGLEGPIGFNTNYNICIRHHLVFDYIYT